MLRNRILLTILITAFPALAIAGAQDYAVVAPATANSQDADTSALAPLVSHPETPSITVSGGHGLPDDNAHDGELFVQPEKANANIDPFSDKTNKPLVPAGQ